MNETQRINGLGAVMDHIVAIHDSGFSAGIAAERARAKAVVEAARFFLTSTRLDRQSTWEEIDAINLALRAYDASKEQDRE